MVMNYTNETKKIGEVTKVIKLFNAICLKEVNEEDIG